MEWLKKTTFKYTKLIFKFEIYLLIILIIIFSIASVTIQSIHANSNEYFKIIIYIFNILASAIAGVLISVVVINFKASAHAEHAYIAIIRRLIELTISTYVDVLGNYGEGDLINSLSLSAYDPTVDGSTYIKDVRSRLREKAERLRIEEDKYNELDKKFKYYTYGGYKYDRTKRYVKDLTDIYYRDAIYNTTDKDLLKELYHSTDIGLRLLGLIEGDFYESARFRMLDLFLEENLKLYKKLLSQIGVKKKPP